MASTDLIQQMTKECRRLAAAARSADDRAFWLGLAERWKAVDARQPCLRHGPFGGHSQSIAPAGEEGQPGLSPAERRRPLSQPSRLR